ENLRVRLPGRICLVAVDAPRMGQDARDGPEQAGIRHRGGLAAAARRDPGHGLEYDNEQGEGTHHVCPRVGRSWRSSGHFRTRIPVAAKMAFASAGAVTAVGGSPIPPGASELGMICTSIAGASLIRSTR